MKVLKELFDWSEVWALLIPLAVLLRRPKQPAYFRPIIVYLWLALVIDLLIDVSWKFKDAMPHWLKDNNYLYNVHSVVRFVCFSSFFLMLRQPFQERVKQLLPVIALVFTVINFLSLESFFQKNTISSNLFALEAGFLLVYCLLYFLYRLQVGETTALKRTADFWVVLGLSVYVVLNFFYFLFYKTLLEKGYGKTLASMWNIHNVTFIILCIFIARAFYVSRHQRN